MSLHNACLKTQAEQRGNEDNWRMETAKLKAFPKRILIRYKFSNKVYMN